MGIAKEQRVGADIQAITTQLRVYEMLNYAPPTTSQGLEALVKKPSGSPTPPKWRQLMETIPLDPWGNPYQYAYPGQHGMIDIYSLGADGREGGEGLNADIGNWQG